MTEVPQAPGYGPPYCDVSLPVPLDRPFTYALPETLRHRVKPGCRLLVPFGGAQADRDRVAGARRCARGRRARSAAAAGQRPGAQRGAAGAGPLDRRLLLRAAGRGSAHHGAARGRDPPREGLLAYRQGAGCAAAAHSGRPGLGGPGGRADAPARVATPLGGVSRQEERGRRAADSGTREEGLPRSRGRRGAARSLPRALCEAARRAASRRRPKASTRRPSASCWLTSNCTPARTT